MTWIPIIIVIFMSGGVPKQEAYQGNIAYSSYDARMRGGMAQAQTLVENNPDKITDVAITCQKAIGA